METEPLRIALIVDNPLRDLPGLSLLALELASRGCKVFLVPMYLNDEVFSLAPDFILLNYMRKVSNGFIQALVNNNLPFGVLDTEGGPNQDAKLYVSYWCNDPKLTAEATCICAWGPQTAEALEKTSLFKKGCVQITGQPRFDIYFEPWRKTSSFISKHVTEIPQPFILVCSNFGFTSSQYGDRNQIAKSLIELYGIEESLARTWQEEEDLAIVQMVECVSKLAIQFPQLNIVYRPHPFEKTSFYEEQFKGHPNVILSKKGDISAWMIEAKAVIQLNCTTCYDAWFAQTPSFKPGWIKQTSGIGDDMAINEICPTFEELAKKIGQTVNGDKSSFSTPSRKEALVEHFFGILDGKAYVRVADVILHSANLVARTERLRNLDSIKKSPLVEAGSRTPFLERIKIRLFLKMGFQSTWRPSNLSTRKKLLSKYESSEKYFTADLVQKWVGDFALRKGTHSPRIAWASEKSEYPFGGRHGKSVLVESSHSK